MEDDSCVIVRDVSSYPIRECVCVLCGRHMIADGVNSSCRNCRLKNPALKRQPAPKWRKKEDDTCQKPQGPSA